MPLQGKLDIRQVRKKVGDPSHKLSFTQTLKKKRVSLFKPHICVNTKVVYSVYIKLMLFLEFFGTFQKKETFFYYSIHGQEYTKLLLCSLLSSLYEENGLVSLINLGDYFFNKAYNFYFIHLCENKMENTQCICQ